MSRAANLGAVGNGPSSHAVLSETGEYVAFESEATNLDPAATFGADRVYRRQIDLGDATVLVSRRTGATGAPSAGHEPSISDDGGRIAFTSEPSEAVVSADNNTFTDVYVRDMAAGTTVLASRADGAGDVGNGNSRSPVDRRERLLRRIRVGRDPVRQRARLGHGAERLPALADGEHHGARRTSPPPGRRATSRRARRWTTPATSWASSPRRPALDPDDPNPTRDAYVKNLATNEIQVASRLDGANGKVANAGVAAVAMSGDGTRIGLGMDSGAIAPDLDPRHGVVVLRELTGARHTDPVSRPAGSTGSFVSAGGFANGGALSADGRYAAFGSDAPALGLPDGVRSAIFVRDRVTGEVTLASRADGPSGAPFLLSARAARDQRRRPPGGLHCRGRPGSRRLGARPRRRQDVPGQPGGRARG